MASIEAGCSGISNTRAKVSHSIRKDRRHLSDEGVDELLGTLANGAISDLEVSDDDPDDPLWEEDVVSQYQQEESDSAESDVEDNDFEKKKSKITSAKKRKSTGKSYSSVNNKRMPLKKNDRFGWKSEKFTMPPDVTWKGKLKESEYDELPTPFSLFTKYYNDNFFLNVTEKTNSYAFQKTGKHLNTNVDEIKQLFGMHILMGCLRFPQLRMYWANYTRIPKISEIMSRARFSLVRNNLHVVDFNEQSTTNRIYKVQPLLDQFRNRCLQLNLEQDLSIDEQIIPFKGKVNIKQYVKGKPTPWGIKMFLLCGKSGQVYDFLVYQGSTTQIPPEDMKEFGLGPSVIKVLSERIPKYENYRLFFDNYFSSVKIFQYLFDEGVLAAGTMRKDRLGFIPKEGAKKKRGHSTEYVNRDKDVVLVEWIDNKEVTLASNFTGIGQEDEAIRWDKSKKSYVSVTRPEIVKKYNESMGGVDTMDMLISLYRISLRTRKWPLRVMFHFVDLAICNSWIEYREAAKLLKVKGKDILNLLPFRMEVAESLIKVGIVPKERKRGRPSTETPKLMKKRKQPASQTPNSDIRFDNIGHMPIIVSDKSQRCKLETCSFKTRFQCEKCAVFLCIVRERNCFKDFHS